MSQILSQTEVDALLSAVNSGSVDLSENKSGDPAQTPTGPSGVNNTKTLAKNQTILDDDGSFSIYDLANQDRVIRGKLPALDLIYERFIRSFRISLSNSLRKIASINIISTEMLKFGEFINTLPIPSCMAILRYEELRGPALLVFESKLVYALIDSFFGGSDRPFTKIDGKEFTTIELSIIRRVVDLAVIDLEEAWSSIHKTKVGYIRTEQNPQFVGVVPPNDVVVTTTFEVELENASGTIALVVPYSILEPIKQKLTSGYQSENEGRDKRWLSTLNTHLSQTKLEMVVGLGETQLNINRLVNLKVGDVMILSSDANSELPILVEGVERFSGFFGVSKGQRALQISKELDGK